MGHLNSMFILCADIGGTNSRFAVFKQAGSDLDLVDKVWIESTKVLSFKELLLNLSGTSLKDFFSKIDVVVIAGAGPVEDNSICSPPNLTWKIFRTDLDRYFKTAKQYIINDFLAQAYSSISKCGDEARLVKSGVKKDGAIAVVGAGTGLGKGYLVKTSSGYLGFPSEGGHAPFSSNSSSELDIVEFVKSKSGHKAVSWEEMCAGRSFSYFYEYFYKEVKSPSEVSALMCNGQADEVADIYSKIVGRMCRAFALEILSTGGIYIAGGVLAKNPYLLENANFQSEFLNSDTQRELLREIPIYLIDNEDSGLWGAAQFGLSHR